MRVVATSLVCVAVLFSWSCSEETTRPGVAVCEPGATQQCFCTGGGTGVQICATDGVRWGICSGCPGQPPLPDAGLPPGDGSAAPPDGLVAPPDAATAADAPPTKPQQLPVMFAAGHYLKYKGQLAGLGPFIVYAWAADPALGMYDQQLQTLSQINDPQVEEWVMYSSLKTIQSKLGDPGHVSHLKSLGVTGLGYNTEGDKTPSSEMQNLGQAVSQFAQLAESKGFDAVWGPIRATADHVSDADYQQMISAGLDGIGLQEQKWIEAACVPDRAAAVKALSARVKKYDPSFLIQVQLMPSRCLNGDHYAQSKCGTSGPSYHHCQAFSDAIEPVLGSIAIWASSPTDNAGLVPLIRALRHE